jgi:ATP-dependent exoDNAse (exonuclease V) beta subunit
MFTLYKASAGSGKTSRLVVEYLALCLPQPEKFKHVLAITFTNNATAEMKSRIVDTLSLLAFETEITPASPIYHSYNQIVAKIGFHMPQEERFTFIKKQSKILLEKILYEYDRFSISTIDSFFQRILRAFALEFGLNTNFNLEIELDDFFKETITVLLNRISIKNEELTSRVLDLVKNLMLEKGKWKVERELLELLELIMKEEVFIPLKKLQDSGNNNFEQAKKKINRETFRIKAQLKNFTTKEEKKSEIFLSLQEELKELMFFGKNLYKLSLLFDLKTIMDEIKEQDNRFFISETNVKISEKLGNDDVPFIYEKIGNQYSYFFIDEFQDTSKLQWHNIIPLVKNALSGDNKFSEQGKLFLFGDLKQAIYRFRNGDADILKQISKIEGFRAEVLPFAKQEEDYRVELLDTNYRSSIQVVEFNNMFFNHLTSENGHFCEARDFYEDVVQKIKPTAEEGLVSVRFQEENDTRKFPEYLSEHLLNTILDALQRGYHCKDLAVLVSSNDLASYIGTFLVAHNLPIVSTESLQLSSSPEINLVIASLKYLASEDDKLAKLSIIHYLTKQNNLELNFYIQCVHNEVAFQQFLTDINIEINRENLKKLSLFTLIHELFRIFSFPVDNPFLISLLDETESFVTKRKGSISLFLEWWEENGSRMSLSTPPGIEAITISTVHKAKGLEYPVVIFPCSQYSFFKTKPNIFVQDQVTGLEYDWVTLTNDKTPQRYIHKCEEESKKTLIDKLNMLYVAHTRAGKELHIITEKATKGNYSKFLAECVPAASCSLPRHSEQSEESLSRHSEQSEESLTIHLGDHKGNPYNHYHISTSSHHPISSSAQQRGLFVHDFLATLTVFPQNEKEIDAFVQNVEEQYQDALVSVFNKILNDKTLQHCFGSNVRVLNETSILFPNGNMFRPDRVVFLDESVVVIDYKTGAPCASHKEQIDHYCDAIRAMGYKNVDGRILYI